MAMSPVTRVQLDAFGPFESLDLTLSPRLNVIVGENGTGKSQLMKVLYTCTKVLHEASSGPPALTKGALTTALADKLVGVFRPDRLGRLANRAAGRKRSRVIVHFDGDSEPLSFNFAINAASTVAVESVPDHALSDEAVFLPTRELLSIYPGFLSLYENREVEFDETWRDTISLLGLAALRGPRGQSARRVLEPLTSVMEGTVVEEGGRFYVKRPHLGNIEASLVAEGERKLATMVRLVSSGVLLQGGYLFWDEPEANLNPRTQRVVAEAIDVLADQGSQVTIATHSLFLLRELQMSRTDDADAARFIGLSRDENGSVTGESVLDLDDLTVLPSLEAELEQSHRYLTA